MGYAGIVLFLLTAKWVGIGFLIGLGMIPGQVIAAFIFNQIMARRIRAKQNNLSGAPGKGPRITIHPKRHSGM